MGPQVSPFSFPPAFIGVGYGVPSPGSRPVAVDVRKEYVAGGYGFLARGYPQVLPWMVDDLTRDFGPAVYDAMHTDPMVGATFRLFKMSVLSNQVQVTPALQPKDELRDAADRAGWTPDETLAEDVAGFVRRALARCRTPVKAACSQMLDSARHGNALAEKVFEPGAADDAGRLTLKDLKVKPRWAWMFVTDVFLDPLGVLAYDPDLGGFVVIPRSKFWVATWQPENNDPRGTSLYRTPYRSWNAKQLLIPRYYRYLVQSADPKRIGTTSEATTGTEYPAFDTHGKPIPGKWVTSEEQMLSQLELLGDDRTALVLPPGSTVQTEWPQGNGDAWLKAFDFHDRQIVYGVLGSTREALEAEHGSRADSETSQDKTGNQLRAAREFIEAGLREDVVKDLVRVNWGDDVADRLTPLVSLGDVEHQDVTKLMAAVAALLKAGGIDRRSQLPAIHAQLGLPQAAPGAFDDDGVNADGSDDTGKDEEGETKSPEKR